MDKAYDFDIYRSMKATGALPPSNEIAAGRRDRILDAAEALFAQRGVRGVTMEAVAEAARIAKATLYGYFGNKDVLFEGVARRLADALAADFTGELEGDGPLDDMISAALRGKHGRVFRLVRGSTHARELFSTKDRLAHAFFEASDATMIAALAKALGKDPALSVGAELTARALFFGAVGLADQSTDAAGLDHDVGVFTEIYLTGARALARPRERSS
jgi:AcrR family transcriptional regulator